MTDRHLVAERGHGPTTQVVPAACEESAPAVAAAAVMTPRAQAEAAWHPSSRYSVAELEALIRQYRGIAALNPA